MHCWNWHDFEDETEVVEPDEFEQYNFDSENGPIIQVVRQFWAGKLESGHLYTVGFVKIEEQSVIKGLLGEFEYNDQPLSIPKSGAWVVTFDLADEKNDFDHVELSYKAKKDLASGVACALYDHYNVTKAGLYCWYAARKELLSIYDTALGFDVDRNLKLKVLPLTNNLHRLGDQERGYAIFTQYY
ncbi:TPA: hypothetical protein ACXJRF_001402 [Serratia marcescens]|uniref:hypothetical protein n=1 Tax=Serratia marcescens TaxID=615 RepID=UPI001249D58D|nr:hypothetical protein [Serratia marcescens]KAB1581262.1 hypothetical protein F7687_08525 [Serratia marcescens]